MQKYLTHVNIGLIFVQCLLCFFIYSNFIATGLNDIYTHKGYIFLVFIGLLIYFIPTFIASAMNKKYLLQIFLLNLFLGFTFVGWLGALIWATIKTDNNEDYSKIITIALQIFCILSFIGFCVNDYRLFNYDTVKAKDAATMEVLLKYINNK